MKLRSIPLLLLLLVWLFTACTPTETPSSPSSAQAPLPENVQLSGDIDGRLPITMALRRVGNTLSGTYQYTRNGGKLQVQGQIIDGELRLSEFDPAGKKTGTFSGVLQKDELKGTWEGNGRSFPFRLRIEPNAAPKNPAKTSAYEINAPTVTKKEGLRKGKFYTAQWAYPVLSGMRNTIAQSRANLLLLVTIKPMVDEFVRDSEQNPPDAESVVQMYEMEISYDDIWVTPQLVSVQYGIYVNSGGAHPNHYSKTVTINLQTGNEVRLEDLFKPGFLKPLSNLVREELRKDERFADNPNDESLINGTAPKAENYRNVALKSTSLFVKFDPYEIGAYALGDFGVTIPYTALRDWIKVGGLLEKQR